MEKDKLNIWNKARAGNIATKLKIFLIILNSFDFLDMVNIYGIQNDSCATFFIQNIKFWIVA